MKTLDQALKASAAVEMTNSLKVLHDRRWRLGWLKDWGNYISCRIAHHHDACTANIRTALKTLEAQGTTVP